VVLIVRSWLWLSFRFPWTHLFRQFDNCGVDRRRPAAFCGWTLDQIESCLKKYGA
jgi:hypothetical protein